MVKISQIIKSINEKLGKIKLEERNRLTHILLGKGKTYVHAYANDTFGNSKIHRVEVKTLTYQNIHNCLVRSLFKEFGIFEDKSRYMVNILRGKTHKKEIFTWEGSYDKEENKYINTVHKFDDDVRNIELLKEVVRCLKIEHSCNPKYKIDEYQFNRKIEISSFVKAWNRLTTASLKSYITPVFGVFTKYGEGIEVSPRQIEIWRINNNNGFRKELVKFERWMSENLDYPLTKHKLALQYKWLKKE